MTYDCLAACLILPRLIFTLIQALAPGIKKKFFFKSCTCKCSDSDPGTRIIEDLQDPDPGGQKIADKVPKKCRKLAFKFMIYFIKLNTVKIIKQALHLQVNFL